MAFPEFADDDSTLVYDVTHERLGGYREGLGDAWDPALVATATANRPETAGGWCANCSPAPLRRPPCWR